jgi:hypothetical protein
MSETRDAGQAAAADDGSGLDPQQAATLVGQTQRQARRQFEATPPWLSLIRAVVVLAAYGAIWLSVRTQHPYKGPTDLVIVAAYVLVAIVLRATIVAGKRASSGVSGKSRRLRRAEIAALVVTITAVYVFMGALYHAGVSHAIVYGIYPATALLIVGGSVMAGRAAIREDWPVFGASLAAVAVGAGSAFAGPAAVWAAAGLGMFVVLLGHAAATAWLQRG